MSAARRRGRTLRHAARGIALFAVLLLPAAGLAKDGVDGLDEDARRAAASRGVDYLEQEVPRLPDSAGTPRRQFTQAVAGLCYLLDGRTGDRGRTRLVHVKDALLRYLADIEGRLDDPDEIPSQHGRFSSDRLIQYTWPVAMTGLFLAEMHERGLYKADAREGLEIVVDVLERSQQENGGWGHHIVSGRAEETNPDDVNPDDAAERMRREMEERLGRLPRGAKVASAGLGGYPNTLVSSSNLVAGTMGLLARLLGERNVSGLEGARTYFREAALDNGVFPYDPSQRSAYRDPTAPGRGAGALWAWQMLGIEHDEQWVVCREYVMERLDDIAEGHGSPCLNVLYGALATRAMGSDEFLAFRVENEPRIVATQKEDGSLHCICEEKYPGVTCDSDDPFGGRAAGFSRGKDVYTTALHTLVLLLAEKDLRIAKRKPRPTAAPAVTPR